MIEKIIAYSVHNKLLVGLLTLLLAIGGVYSAFQLTIDAVPDITNNQVQVVTVSPSLAPQEIEQFITYPVEIAMSNLQSVEEIRSISRYGLSVVTIVFEESYNNMLARQLVSEQLQIVAGEIPGDLGYPELMPITTGLGEIFQYTLDVEPGYEEQYDATDLRTLQDWIVKRQLAGVPGIVEISSFGGFVKQYEVAVNPDVLRAYNVTINEIAEVLQNNNANTGGSYIQKGPYAFYIRAEGLITSLEDLEKVVVKKTGEVPLLLGDVAQIQFGATPRFGAMTKDGKGEVVGGITLMLKGANATEVIANVKERIAQVQKSLPEGVSINAYLDRAELVDRVISTVQNNLIEGGLIVIFVLVILLGNFRAGIIVASVIPLSMLFALAMMHLFGISANLMSLGAIDFGLIVDGAVVIVESIVHYIHKQNKSFTKAEFDKTVSFSASSIMRSAAFGMLIILIVYIPVMSLTGIEGKMFKPMAYTVSFAILGALILSLTYVPMVSALFLKRKPSDKVTLADRINKGLLGIYKPTLEFALHRKKSILAGALLIFIGAGILFYRMGAVFIPTLEEGDLAMQMTIPPGSSLNESVNSATKAERVLLDNFPEVKDVVSKIGTAEVPTDPMAIEDGDIMIILKEKSEWVSASNREELVAKMKEKLEVIKGAEFEFTQPIQLRFNELITGVKSDIAIKIYGENLEILFDKANEAADIFRNVQGAADIRVAQIEGLPQILLQYDRSKMARYGMDISSVNQSIKAAMAGEVAGVVFEGEKRFDLAVRLQEEFRNDRDIYDHLYVRAIDGQQIPISELVQIKEVKGPMQISRDNTQRFISIGINVRNRDIQSLVEEVQQLLEQQLELPPGYYITYGGQFENLRDATQRLQIAVPLALFLIFMLLFFTFNSIKQAAMIFTAVPLSAVGGVLGLWLRDMPFSISAGVGFIALFGVAVLNGIVLIGYFNQLKDGGVENIYDRVVEGASTRLRPVVMTAAVASMGFIPMAFSTTAGAEVQQPLATVVIFGLITATLLTLIVLPVLYSMVEKPIKQPAKIFAGGLLLLLFIGHQPVEAQQLYGNEETFSSIILPNDTLSNTVKTSVEDPLKKELSLEEALQLAKTNNPLLKNAILRQDAARAQKKGIVALGNTDVNYQQGQINSEISSDYIFSINQSIGNPFNYGAKSKKIQAEVQLAESEALISQKQIERMVSVAWYDYQWLSYKISVLQTFKEQYESMARIAQLRFDTGEEGMLSTLVITSKKEEINSQLEALFADLSIAQKAFNTAIFSEENMVPSNGTAFEKIPFQVAFQAEDSLQMQALLSPVYQVYQQALKVTERELILTQASLAPEISVGAFTQQLDGFKGFRGWQVGVSIPLWFLPKSAAIQQAKIQQRIAANQLQFQRIKLKKELESLMQEAKKFGNRLSYFEDTALPRATLITEKSGLLYSEGEISYYEHLMNLGEANRIRLEYADALREYNKVLIQIKYFLAN